MTFDTQDSAVPLLSHAAAERSQPTADAPQSNFHANVAQWIVLLLAACCLWFVASGQGAALRGSSMSRSLADADSPQCTHHNPRDGMPHAEREDYFKAGKACGPWRRGSSVALARNKAMAIWSDSAEPPGQVEAAGMRHSGNSALRNVSAERCETSKPLRTTVEFDGLNDG